jgi:hypothetical protein
MVVMDFCFLTEPVRWMNRPCYPSGKAIGMRFAPAPQCRGRFAFSYMTLPARPT